MEQKKFYITTAIDYTNAKPHMGHVFEKIMTDVIARYHRSIGDDVFFLTGSDENGLKNQITAEEKGVTPKEWVDERVQDFLIMKEKFNLSYDSFIRTSDPRHQKLVQEIWGKCLAKGDIYKKSYQGLYCVGCEGFVKESDLVDGKCPSHDKEPELVEEENYFFRLSNYKDQIRELLEKEKIRVFPAHRIKEIVNVLNELDDFSISRPKEKLYWGVEVPDDSSQTMYVWFDALSNYLTGIDFSLDSEKFKKYWPADVHVIGKDITRFHAIYWPAMLLSAGIELPKSILAHGFVNSGGKKMSKTLGNVVDPEEALAYHGCDPLRYFVLREIPTTEDGDFSFERFDERYDSDLANSLGNLISRVTNIAENNGIIFKDLNQDKVDLSDYFSEYKLDRALEKIWEHIHGANKHVDESKPWTIKDDPEKLSEIINKLLNDIKIIGEALAPFMPETSEKILKIFKEEKIKKAEPLFPKQK